MVSCMSGTKSGENGSGVIGRAEGPTADEGVEILGRERVYDGFFRVERLRLRHRLFAGGWSGTISRELFERGHAAAVLPYDPWRDAVVLIEQFRVGALDWPGGPWLLEIVAGMIEPGETSADVVRREAEEEAGCRIDRLEPIHEYHVSPGGTSERIELFCGRVDSRGVGGLHGLSDEDEDIRVTVHPFVDAFALLEAGRLPSATPIIALQWLERHRARLREAWK